MRKNRNENLLVFLILLVIFSLSTGSAAFSLDMSISKVVADVRISKNVRITDVTLNDISNSNVLVSNLDYDVDSFFADVSFKDVSSYITYRVTISNFGNQEVGVDSILVSDGIGYELLNYNLGDKICNNTSCSLGVSKEIIIKVYPLNNEFVGEKNIKVDFNFQNFHKIIYENMEFYDDYPVEVINGGSFSVMFRDYLKNVSILSNGEEVDYYDEVFSGQIITLNNISSNVVIKKAQCARLVNGNINDTTGEVCIGNECFYIFRNDGSSISMLSKYNLYVGGYVPYSGAKWVSYGNDATGLQDSRMQAFVVGGVYPFHGVVSFSSTNYWVNDVSTYPAYVYNENSNLYVYVENYKSYLQDLGTRVIDARLFSYEDLKFVGYGETSANHYFGKTPSWVYSTSYWFGTARGTDMMASISMYPAYNERSYSYLNSYGLRPVIEIPVSEVSIN